jgi:hypothetical protein
MNVFHAVKVLPGRSYRAWGMINEFQQGYRYGRTFLSQNCPSGPPVKTDLEAYFDSHVSGLGIWKWRHYFQIYDRHLSKFRGADVHLLEVGVYSGGSLGMWRSYLGENAHVYGVDIEPACRAYEDEGIKVLIGDQADREFWQHFKQEVPRLDVVIDDGGHQAFQQIATLESLLPHLQPGGVYICEDIASFSNRFLSYLDGFARNLYLGDGTWTANELQRLVDSVHSYPYVSVIERRAAVLGHFESVKHGTEWARF